MIYALYCLANSGLELGFYIDATRQLSESEQEKLRWLIAETYEPELTRTEPYFTDSDVVAIGPRLSIETPFSSCRVSACHAMGLESITRIESVRRYRIGANQSADVLLKTHLDRMTEQQYPNGITTFDTGITPEPVRIVDLIGRGKGELEEMNRALGLGMDAEDIAYYHHLFVDIWRRNPTDVELFQLGNMNSDHSRHWLFNGKFVIDEVPKSRTLFQIIQEPLRRLTDDTCTRKAFNDNAGVSRGFAVKLLLPLQPGEPSEMVPCDKIVHITMTAETHNHPTAISPFPGAATGAGGEIRDDDAVGRGGIFGIGVVGYCASNLFIPGYLIPGEVVGDGKLSKYASALSIFIEGSNGATSYNNQIGRPVTGGFCRTFEQGVRGEWRGWRKPILYSGGVGHVFEEQIEKGEPETGMLIVRFGGPAFPIGMGGGAASSMMQGQNTEALDFNSVQRGNAEMENRGVRVIRACVEMGDENPIESIHDQGAGGPSNMLTELMGSKGGTVNIREIKLGDKTMSVAQIWSSEFQEGFGVLVWPKRIESFKKICKREGVNCEVLGEITGSGNVVVNDPLNQQMVVDLGLEEVLTHMPQKTFVSNRRTGGLKPLELPAMTVEEAVQAVFKLPSVGSKGWLVHKGDRSVTGLVAQQQCCGIAQIAIADASVAAQSHFGLTGSVTALGEQPLKMLVDVKAGVRMAVGETFTNMASVVISGTRDIRCRVNEMWPAKLPGEGAELYDAVEAVADLLIALGIAANGGKDSSSMAADVEGELVKAPGSVVILGCAPVPDITKKVTPDIKKPGESNLYLIDLGRGKNRLGGSALAQACNQLGDESPDVDDPKLLVNAFRAVQRMISKGLVLAVHDRSDGGLITTVAEMCMASRCGFALYVRDEATALAHLFSEELGWVLEVLPEDEREMLRICNSFNIPCSLTGVTRSDTACGVLASLGGDDPLLLEEVTQLRLWWERTSYEIEKLQMSSACATEEYSGHRAVLPGIDTAPSYRLLFVPKATPYDVLNAPYKPRVAIVREKGSNGDQEMKAACLAAGLAPWDVAMSDLLAGTASLDSFQGVVFVGGFSYMDVFGSAKGWAGTIRFNDVLREMFDRFYAREDTFSLGVCNGAQLMELLGWVPWRGIDDVKQPRLVHNTSGRFESRWVQVEVLPSPSILFTGMEGSRLGVWVAHGEGQQVFPDQSIRKEVIERKLSPLVLLDPWGNPTEEYPYNPNGSPGGITALCSPDGRHTVMMPHFERCFRLWQLPWMPSEWKALEASPCLRMFQNARTWCMERRS